MKRRRSRFIHREELKEQANKHNDLSFEHPQSRRQMEEGNAQIAELIYPTIPVEDALKPGPDNEMVMSPDPFAGLRGRRRRHGSL